MLVGHQFVELSHHHDSSGKVVEHRRHKEREDAQHPNKFFLASSSNFVCNDRKTVVLVDNSHNSHSAEQEEQRLRSFAQMVQALLLNNKRCKERVVVRLVGICSHVLVPRLVGNIGIVEDALLTDNEQNPH